MICFSLYCPFPYTYVYFQESEEGSSSEEASSSGEEEEEVEKVNKRKNEKEANSREPPKKRQQIEGGITIRHSQEVSLKNTYYHSNKPYNII